MDEHHEAGPARNRLAYVDTHTHLDDGAFDADRDEVIERAKLVGVQRMINVGYAPSCWESTIALAGRIDGMAFTLGLHPGHAFDWTSDLMLTLERIARESRPAAIGEIGLDYAGPDPRPELQQRVFEAQLALAQSLELPVVIHQRAAGIECAATLQQTQSDQMVVLHSFDGDPALLSLGIERGWIFGVGGLMTRKSSDSLRTALRSIPLGQLVLETDSPYLIPRGIKARRNTPESIPQIARALADLLQTSLFEIETTTSETAMRVFGLQEQPGEQ